MSDSIFMLNRFPQVSRRAHVPSAAALADVGVTIVRGRLKIEKLRAAEGEVGEFAASFPLRIERLLTAAR